MISPNVSDFPWDVGVETPIPCVEAGHTPLDA